MRIFPVVVTVMSILLSACTVPTSSFYRSEQLQATTGKPIYGVVLKNGDNIRFNHRGGWYQMAASDSSAVVVGTTMQGDSVAIAGHRILELEVRSRESDAAGYAVASAWAAVGIELVIALTIISMWAH